MTALAMAAFTMTAFIPAYTLLAPAPPPDKPTLIVAVGTPGTPEYGQAFNSWAERWEAAAKETGAACHRIGTQKQEAREQLKALLDGEKKESLGPLWLILLGHGTFDGRVAKFNLAGPDISAAELAQWLKPFKRPVAVINCSSSSAPFINRLSAPERIVVTATKSGYEMNYARFGEYLAAAVSDPAADLDKDNQVSLLEAFLVASRRVAEFYKSEARLATETALLDDNGDGLGTPAAWFRGTRAVRRARDGAELDGTRAHQLHLIPSEKERAMPPALRARRDELELAVIKLRDSRKDAEKDDAYYAQLEPLLIELARIYEKMDKEP
jgi:hypothetical protein